MSEDVRSALLPAGDPATGEVPLRALGVTRVYQQGEREVRALSGVDVEVGHGELVALMGPSGSGKSTLLHLLGGLDRPTEGEVLLEGVRLSTLREKELSLIRRRRLGFVFQFFSLFPTMDALENVAFPLEVDGVADGRERALAQLEAVGLGQRADHRPAQLSGGEQQRVALARALVTGPAVLLADEPTGNLDSATGEDMLKLLRAAADSGQATVVATHDAHAAGYADRVIRLSDGRIDG